VLFYAHFSRLHFYLKTRSEAPQSASNNPPDSQGDGGRRSRDLRPPEANRMNAPFRFGHHEAKNSENERIRFAKRNEGFRIAGRKPLKSLGAANHDFAGSFVFKGLSAHVLPLPADRGR
jgi:hypothetical protein